MMKSLFFILFIFIYSNATSLEDFVDTMQCDQIIDKDIYSICYSYKYKGALAGWTVLNGSKVYKKNIKKRPKFYSEPLVPTEYRTYYKDYLHTNRDSTC